MRLFVHTIFVDTGVVLWFTEITLSNKERCILEWILDSSATDHFIDPLPPLDVVFFHLDYFGFF